MLQRKGNIFSNLLLTSFGGVNVNCVNCALSFVFLTDTVWFFYLLQGLECLCLQISSSACLGCNTRLFELLSFWLEKSERCLLTSDIKKAVFSSRLLVISCFFIFLFLKHSLETLETVMWGKSAVSAIVRPDHLVPITMPRSKSLKWYSLILMLRFNT